MRRLYVRTLLALALLLMVLMLAGCSSLKLADRNGPTIVLQVDPKQPGDWPKGASAREAKMKLASDTIRLRISGISGVVDPEVRVESPTSDKARILVKLPGVRDTRDAAKILTAMGSLEFYYLKDIYTTTNPLGKWKMDVSGAELRTVTFTGPKGEVLTSGKDKDDRKIISQVVGPNAKPILTGADLVPNAKSALKTGTSLPIIEIELNERGTEIFRDFTGAHVGEVLAVFYDGKLLTAPSIKDKISDGKAIIEGFPSLREATRIASHLNAGALPVALKVVEIRK
jgi:protein-export membrane protein SecD